MLKGKYIICNLSNFTLGGEVVVKDKEETIFYAKVASQDEAIKTVYALSEKNKIDCVFIVPVSPTDKDKIVREFRQYGKTNFSQRVDKMAFSVI